MKKKILLTVSGIFHPRHVVQATGASGEVYFPTDIDGLKDFRGDRLIHSSQFFGLQSNGNGKKAVIVGSCNSGHDIAQDYYQHGYDVTMVQRSSTLVVTSNTLVDVTMKGLYAEDGVNTLTPVHLNERTDAKLYHRYPSPPSTMPI